MKGSETRLAEFMDGSKKRFVIPVYQRNYDWKIENCKQLYDDLIKVVQNNRKSHFFGSLVSHYTANGKYTDFLVIDGQQRLTTISLLLLAMYNLIEEGIIIPQDESLSKQIYEDFLVDKYQPKEKRIKLKPVKNDNKAFEKLFEKEDEHIKSSHITLNYNYFYNRIQKQEITIDELFDAIYKLEIISITLENDDNPQLIFESLNSTGLDLSEGDKIRNYVLMSLSPDKQEEYYENYWNKIEECTKYDVSSFVRDYLSLKNQTIPSQKKVYIEFKEYKELKKIDTDTLLKELLSYAKRYEILLGKKKIDKRLDACIFRLNRLETTVTRPYFLEVLQMLDNGDLNINQVVEVFLITENYLIRRMMCDLPTNVLNKIFLTLNREIIRYDETCDNYVEKMKYALLSKKEKGRFPDDEEFQICFSEKPVYLMNGKNKIYLLERIENYGTLEDKDIYRHVEDGDYSIEHIMPQHLTPVWKKELGDDFEDIHNIWLHRIANLTLTAYNSQYSNNRFIEKKTREDGFINSGLRMNTYFTNIDEWTLKQLEDRNEFLKDKALNIWASPKTTYIPPEKELESYSLDEDPSIFKGRNILKFSFRSTEQPVSSWVEMYLKVLQILFDEDSSYLVNLAQSEEDGIAQHFTFDSKKYISSEEIADGIYVWTNSNTQSKLSNLQRLFNLYEIDPNELVFYLREVSITHNDEPGSRFELRRRYWTYALESIHSVHGSEGSFSNVNASKENWISGFVGINGICINCVANYDHARVEVYFGNRVKEINKQKFDVLYSHKSEIEKTLGVNLQWDRNDDSKSSRVSIKLDGVSIENEVDWLQMSKFHSEWSKKFLDVLIPWLN